MTAFLLELLTEEIPARMQADAVSQLHRRLYNGMLEAGLIVGEVRVFVTPRRLAAIAHEVADTSVERSDERRGPRADAPDAAIAGFVKSTGVARDRLEARDTPKGRFLYATVVTPGRPAAAILAELVPAIVHGFDWPKSMRWGAASASTASPRWVRPLAGIVALLGDAVVPLTAAGIASGRTTVGHRFLSSGPIAIASAASYADQLRAAHVVLDPDEREAMIVAGAEAAAAAAGLVLIPDAGLVAENAGLTEWPVPLLGRFDSAFLAVPREVIQLTMRTNQKYFACADADGALAPAFVAVANLPDAGGHIAAGNAKVLAARLADARFFWDADVARVRAGGLASFTPKLADIVFHEKLGTVADKVERVAKLARWLVDSGAVAANPPRHGEGDRALLQRGVEGRSSEGPPPPGPPPLHRKSGPPPRAGEDQARLATLAETAARLCKADLVSATVGEFPEVQGIAGGHLARVEGLDPQIAAAIRDHYKPVGPSDEVPTAPVTVAVALADKLDTLVGFFAIGQTSSGSRDPFALRRTAISICGLVLHNKVRLSLISLQRQAISNMIRSVAVYLAEEGIDWIEYKSEFGVELAGLYQMNALSKVNSYLADFDEMILTEDGSSDRFGRLQSFLADRLKVQQREAGIRPDVIDAVFSLGCEDDLVRLVARAKALQAVLQTPDGASLLAGYRRGANIVRIEQGKTGDLDLEEIDRSLLTEPAEVALDAALETAVPAAAAAVAAEDFAGAMTALARLRPAVDAFFDHVTVNAHEAHVRRNRLALLARLRTAVHSVADFSKLEG